MRAQPTYRRYTWVGNRIDPGVMAKMYHIRKITGKPITVQVAEAVRIYAERSPAGKEE
jgi:hypothetical protein